MFECSAAIRKKLQARYLVSIKGEENTCGIFEISRNTNMEALTNAILYLNSSCRISRFIVDITCVRDGIARLLLVYHIKTVIIIDEDDPRIERLRIDSYSKSSNCTVLCLEQADVNSQTDVSYTIIDSSEICLTDLKHSKHPTKLLTRAVRGNKVLIDIRSCEE